MCTANTEDVIAAAGATPAVGNVLGPVGTLLAAGKTLASGVSGKGPLGFLTPKLPKVPVKRDPDALKLQRDTARRIAKSTVTGRGRAATEISGSGVGVPGGGQLKTVLG